MSYVSLARKYRPRRFVDMVGQESTTLALTNAIRLRREPHSVIFTGVRGVGKTTSARIYAKALNCENGPTAEPCDVCSSCEAIASGNHEDVLEIDGASNTGVDDVRALQETLSYVPQRSTYKIYIIDEVHMLSISAFNALLKTLEEPPQHVLFIFATTELHKVPETIQSRCQTFHLQKISRPVIADRVRTILSAEGIPFDEAALAIVAREGRGSMRDALTMLDQAIAVGGGQVSLEALKNMVGSSSQALPVLELLDGLLRKDASQILEVIARWDQEGLAMSALVEETAKACRNAFILRDLKGQAIDLQLLDLEDREQQMLLELGEKAAPMDLNRLFRQLAKCLDDLRHADLDRFILENYCLEWCFDPGLPDLQTLMSIISSSQPVQPIPTRPAAPQPAEASAINLRDRWKSSTPNGSAPAARPAAPQSAAAQSAAAQSAAAQSVAPESAASQPGSAPASKPTPPPGKTPAPQASLERPPAATPGPALTNQPPAPSLAVNSSGMPSSLLQKLAMAQAAQAAAPAAPAPFNPLAARAAMQSRPVLDTPLAAQPTPPPQGKPVSEPQTLQPAAELHEAAEKTANSEPSAREGQAIAAPGSSREKAETTEPSPARNSSAEKPVAPEPSPARTAFAQSSGSGQNPPRNASAENSTRPQPNPAGSAFAVPPSSSEKPNPAQPMPTRMASGAGAQPTPPRPTPSPAKSGGRAQTNVAAVPPEPLPPFDLNDDDIPPWLLQEEASRQGALLAPPDEPMPLETPQKEGFLALMTRRAASEPPTPPAATPVQAETETLPSSPAADAQWPETWRAFVDEWKKQKPLQGRVLEEAYVLEYSPQRIRLAVEPSSMAGGKLLQQDVRKRLMEQFTQLFGFKGVLEAVPKADAHPGKSANHPAPDLGETLLDVKNREREVAREHLRVRLEEHPMTREVISRFGGTIEQIELQ